MKKFALNLTGATLGVIFCSIGSGNLHAQAVYLSQVDQASQVNRSAQLTRGQQPQQSAPDLYPGENSDTGDQILLGSGPKEVQQPAKWDWFQADINTQYFYTSNAGLSATGIKGTGLMINTLNAEVDVPPLTIGTGKLYPRVGYTYQWFDYGIFGPGHNLGNLDFDAASLYAEAQYMLPDQWSLIGDLTYTRLLNDGNGYNEFYKELVPQWGVQKVLTIREGVDAVISYQGAYHFTDEPTFYQQGRDANDRTDQALTLMLNCSVNSKLTISPFYRFQYSYFPSYLAGDSRSDFIHTFGLSANYSFNSWSSIQVFVSYEMRDSSMPALADYRKLDAGGGLSLTWKF